MKVVAQCGYAVGFALLTIVTILVILRPGEMFDAAFQGALFMILIFAVLGRPRRNPDES